MACIRFHWHKDLTNGYAEYDPEFGMGDHMFKDLTLSKDMMGEFHRKHHGNDERQVSVSVLQRSFWPFSARKTDIILPTFVRAQYSF